MTITYWLSAGAAAITALGAALGAAGAQAQEHSFTFHHFLSELSPAHTEMLVPWAARVMELSGGAVAIEISPNMTLGGRPPELIQQVRDGVVDLVWTVNGYTAGLFPRSEVFELPTVYLNDPAAANLAMRAMFEDHLAEDYAGVEVMFLHVHGGNGIHTVGTEVRAPGDLADLTLRTPTRTGSWVIEALGATPVAMPVPELPQALARGTVEGALIPWEVAAPLRLQEQTQYQIEGHDKARFGNTVFPVSMNAARWQDLPPEIQDAFRQASDEAWLQEAGEIWRRTDDTVIEMLVGSGNTHITLTEDETAAFMDALEPVVGRWIEDVSGQGIDGAALVEAARAAIDSGGSGMEEAAPAPRRGAAMLVERAATLWALAGGMVVLGVVAINTWSVLGQALARRPFAGTVELTELGVAVAVFAFLPYCQLMGANVTADIFTARAGPRAIAAFALAASIVALGFSLLLAQRMYLGLLDQQAFRYTTAILQVRIWWAFVPMVGSLLLLAAASAVTLGEAAAKTARG
ncbi:hypothetical protein BH23PSE1_BH23PSE1_05100 [soil metagenome]